MGSRTPTATTSTLTTTLSGSATAVGDSTLITGTIISTATDVGPVTLTSGTSTFTATAQSTDDDLAYATAETYAGVEGEDLLLTLTQISTGTNYSGNQTTMTATSSTSLFALDIEAVDLPTGTITVEQEGSCDPATFDGNVATFDLAASATAENTYVEADVSLVTTDGISTIDALSVTIA